MNHNKGVEIEIIAYHKIKAQSLHKEEPINAELSQACFTCLS